MQIYEDLLSLIMSHNYFIWAKKYFIDNFCYMNHSCDNFLEIYDVDKFIC